MVVAGSGEGCAVVAVVTIRIVIIADNDDRITRRNQGCFKQNIMLR